jgi:minimal PKS chain-length factor (CLF/KS beta)
MNDPVVVTGLGVIAPNGVGTEEYWKATMDGRTGIAPVEEFAGYPVAMAGRVDFDVEEHLPGRLLPQTDRVTRLALVAAEWALADAAVDPAQLPEYEQGVLTSNASGGFEFTHSEIKKLWTDGPQYVSVYESFAWFYAVNTGQISIRHGLRGPGGVLVAEQAGGLDALGHARRTLRRGMRLMVTGGVESSFDPWGWVSHMASGRLSTSTYRPFDTAADGYLPGEGGAILVTENASAARERGNTSWYGEIAGYAATFDPKPGSGRPPGLARAISLALADADVRADDVDVVFADAAGVPELDKAEADAITDVFGPHGVPVTAPKALVGRLYAGGPPLDVATALLSIRDSVIPPTAATESVPDDYRCDVVLNEPRTARLRTVLVLARGKGGHNAAVVLRAPSIN